MADDIRELNALIADYGREFQSPDPRSGPSLASARLYNTGYQPATATEQTEMALSFLPGIGEGLDAAHFVKDIQDEKYGSAGLSGLSMMLPFVGAGTLKKIAGKKSDDIDEVAEAIKFREGPPINIEDTMQISLLTSDGKPPEALYRVVSREEFDKAQKSGKFTPSSHYGRIHASSAPDMRYRNAPDDVVIKIKYDPDDGWYAKWGDEVYGVTQKDIPISRTSVIKKFKKGGSVVERSNKHEPKAI